MIPEAIKEAWRLANGDCATLDGIMEVCLGAGNPLLSFGMFLNNIDENINALTLAMSNYIIVKEWLVEHRNELLEEK